MTQDIGTPDFPIDSKLLANLKKEGNIKRSLQTRYSSPINSSIYGALMGGLLVNTFSGNRKDSAENKSQ